MSQFWTENLDFFPILPVLLLAIWVSKLLRFTVIINFRDFSVCLFFLFLHVIPWSQIDGRELGWWEGSEHSVVPQVFPHLFFFSFFLFFWHLGGDDNQEGWWGEKVRKGWGSMCTGERESGCRTRVRGGYLSPFCSLTPPSPALSVVPLLLVAAAPPSASSSSVFTLFDSGWSCSSPFCLLVGRDAEAEAWAARRWRGFATAGREGEIILSTESKVCHSNGK